MKITSYTKEDLFFAIEKELINDGQLAAEVKAKIEGAYQKNNMQVFNQIWLNANVGSEISGILRKCITNEILE